MVVEHTVPPRSTLEQQAGYSIQKQDKSRFWEVRDAAGELVCLTVYRRGAREVVRRLHARTIMEGYVVVREHLYNIEDGDGRLRTSVGKHTICSIRIDSPMRCSGEIKRRAKLW